MPSGKCWSRTIKWCMIPVLYFSPGSPSAIILPHAYWMFIRPMNLAGMYERWGITAWEWNSREECAQITGRTTPVTLATFVTSAITPLAATSCMTWSEHICCLSSNRATGPIVATLVEVQVAPECKSVQNPNVLEKVEENAYAQFREDAYRSLSSYWLQTSFLK
jgi:hypothetical protein